jgi:hypothetical protein
MKKNALLFLSLFLCFSSRISVAVASKEAVFKVLDATQTGEEWAVSKQIRTWYRSENLIHYVRQYGVIGKDGPGQNVAALILVHLLVEAEEATLFSLTEEGVPPLSDAAEEILRVKYVWDKNLLFHSDTAFRKLSKYQKGLVLITMLRTTDDDRRDPRFSSKSTLRTLIGLSLNYRDETTELLEDWLTSTSDPDGKIAWVAAKALVQITLRTTDTEKTILKFLQSSSETVVDAAVLKLRKLLANWPNPYKDTVTFNRFYQNEKSIVITALLDSVDSRMKIASPGFTAITILRLTSREERRKILGGYESRDKNSDILKTLALIEKYDSKDSMWHPCLLVPFYSYRGIESEKENQSEFSAEQD